jgi:capsular polysaccharide biosynthesis protein
MALDCVVIIDRSGLGESRRAALDFTRASGLSWRVVLDQPTCGKHPTLGDGLLVLQAGDGPGQPVALATETSLVEPVELESDVPNGRSPLVTVLHYRNPWVGIQDYPHLEILALKHGASLTEAFENSTGDYVVVVDGDVRLTSGAVSEAVRSAERQRAPTRGRARGRRYRPLAQAEYFPSWRRSFDDKPGPQTVTVAPESTVQRDNLVALDLDPQLDDPAQELAARLGGGSLEGPAAQCSRVPGGVVAGRAGAVLTADGGWLVESVGSRSRAWPDLALDDDGRVGLTGPVRSSDLEVAVVVCERRRAWWTANFGHWTLEVLTRAAILLHSGAPADVKLLVPEPVLPFQRETLAGLGIDDSRILAWDGGPTRFRTVYVPTAHSTPPFLFPAGVELLHRFAYGARSALPWRRLFVSRRKIRRTAPRISNERELLAIAANLGFVEIRPEALPYAKQMRRFAEAEIVVGAHGSGLANAVFMAPGTAMFELAPARLPEGKVRNFWDLAACARQRYGLCVAPGRSVDPERFRRVLADVVQSQKE